VATIFRLSASAPLAAPAANDPTCLCGRRCVRCPDCSRSTPLVESAFESKPGVTLIMVDIGDKQNWWDAAPTHSAVFPGVHSCSRGQFLQARPRERPPSGDGAIRRQMPPNGAPARRKAGHRSREVQGANSHRHHSLHSCCSRFRTPRVAAPLLMRRMLSRIPRRAKRSWTRSWRRTSPRLP